MVSTKGRYALRFMIDLARREPGAFVPLDVVAQSQGISRKYLEAIVKQLVEGGMVEGLRGKGGGYRLARDAASYTAYEILAQTEASMCAVTCLEEGAPPCERAAQCETLPMWKRYDAMKRDFFSSITLAELAGQSA